LHVPQQQTLQYTIRINSVLSKLAFILMAESGICTIAVKESTLEK
jgi:hypothetical protein